MYVIIGIMGEFDMEGVNGNEESCLIYVEISMCIRNAYVNHKGIHNIIIHNIEHVKI